MTLNLSKYFRKKTELINSNKILSEIQKIKSKIYKLSTGSKNLDKVLDGGFQAKKMYLIFGANKTGKTQICHQLCIEAYKQKRKSYYLDTENTFRPERINQLAVSQNLNYDEILKNILVSKILSNSALLLKLNEVKEINKESNLLIIDSLNNYYRVEQGASFFQTKTKFLNILELLNKITNRYNLITIATAQISPNYMKNAVVSELPVGLQLLNHYFSEFIYLRYKEKEKEYLHLINSYTLAEKKILYRITNLGIEDHKI